MFHLTVAKIPQISLLVCNAAESVTSIIDVEIVQNYDDILVQYIMYSMWSFEELCAENTSSCSLQIR